MNYRENMDAGFKNKKKRLDFDRASYVVPTIKYPCQELSNRMIAISEVPNEKISMPTDEESSLDSEVSSTSTVARETINVHLRLKPVEEVPDVYSFDPIEGIVALKGTNQNVMTERQYTFTSILDGATDQKSTYESCVRGILSDPFASQGAVFASYGVSNSGKTYTILGEHDAGIVPRALTQIFAEHQHHIAKLPCIKVVNDQITILDDGQVQAEVQASLDFQHESRKQHKGKLIYETWNEAIRDEHGFAPKPVEADRQQVHIWISFLEIYNEKMIDLFKLERSGGARKTVRPLKIISNNRNSYVHGLTWLYVASVKVALELLQHGLRRVNYASTGLNQHSSRSHTIFTITAISESDSSYEFSSFKFCDLAGAERSSKTGNVGQLLKEAGGINTSLLVLGRCLEAVQNNQKPDGKKTIVPVRESKLTFLLQSSLMGQENFVMIVNLLPSLECYEENINVLLFGSLASKIVTRKAKPRKHSRASSYNFFMQQTVGGAMMNTSLAFDESMVTDESSLDDSFKRHNMEPEELRHELRRKNLECSVLRNIIEQKEREFLDKEQKIRQEHFVSLRAAREAEKKYAEEKEMMAENYYEKKMASQKLKWERREQELNDQIYYYERERKKMRKQLGLTDDPDIIDLEDSESEDEEESSDENQENRVPPA